MLLILGVFIASFVQSYIGTVEVYNISKVHPRKAAAWAACNETASFLVTFAIIVSVERIVLLLPCIVGNTLATYIALRRRQ